MSFAGRTALITGAASGIGAATAQWLASQGIAALVLVDLDASGMAALDLPCPARSFTGDVADPALWEQIEAEVPRLDHALINAGVANGGALTTLEFAEWRRILSINLDGAFLALRSALRIMQRDSGPKSAVLTSSAVGIKPVAMTAAYGSSKAAVIHLARIAAAEHLSDGIRVNAVAPGRVETADLDQDRPVQGTGRRAGQQGSRAESRGSGSPRAGRFHHRRRARPPDRLAAVG